MTREQVYQNVSSKYDEYIENKKTRQNFTNRDIVGYYDFKDNADMALEVFSEGNEILAYLLNTCIERKVITRGCCKGHGNKKPAYISLEYMPENMAFITNLLSKLDMSEVEIRMEKKSIGEHEISFSTYQNSDNFFESIRQIIIETTMTEDYSNSIPSDIKEMLKIFDEDKLGDSSSLVLYYKKTANKNNYTVITAEPSYLRVNNSNVLTHQDKGSSVLFFRTPSQQEAQDTLNQVVNNIKKVNRQRLENGQTIPLEDNTQYPIVENPEIGSVIQTAIGFEMTQSKGAKTHIEVSSDQGNIDRRIVKITNQKIGRKPLDRVIFSYDNGYDFDNMILPELLCAYLEKKEIKDRVYRETHNGSKGIYAVVDKKDNTLLIENLDTPVVIKAGLTVNELMQSSKGKIKAKKQGPSL